jgi:hypothetical protein
MEVTMPQQLYYTRPYFLHKEEKKRGIERRKENVKLERKGGVRNESKKGGDNERQRSKEEKQEIVIKARNI